MKMLDEDFLIVTGGKIDKWKIQTLTLMKVIKKTKIKKCKIYYIWFSNSRIEKRK